MLLNLTCMDFLLRLKKYLNNRYLVIVDYTLMHVYVEQLFQK